MQKDRLNLLIEKPKIFKWRYLDWWSYGINIYTTPSHKSSTYFNFLWVISWSNILVDAFNALLMKIALFFIWL